MNNNYVKTRTTISDRAADGARQIRTAAEQFYFFNDDLVLDNQDAREVAVSSKNMGLQVSVFRRPASGWEGIRQVGELADLD